MQSVTVLRTVFIDGIATGCSRPVWVISTALDTSIGTYYTTNSTTDMPAIMDFISIRIRKISGFVLYTKAIDQCSITESSIHRPTNLPSMPLANQNQPVGDVADGLEPVGWCGGRSMESTRELYRWLVAGRQGDVEHTYIIINGKG